MSEELRIEIARNAAANGRAICVMLFAACLAMFVVGHIQFKGLAVLSIAPLASSYIADLYIRSATAKLAIALTNIVVLIVIAFCLLLA